MNQIPDMKGLKSHLLWEGIPLLMPLSIFGFISVVDWDYEGKLITPDTGASDWTGVHLGLILLVMAMGQALAASFILFIVRITRPKSSGGGYMLAWLTVVALFLIIPSLFIIIMGPAALPMMEQMRVAPS